MLRKKSEKVNSEENHAKYERNSVNESSEVGRFRRVLPQVLASMTRNLLQLSTGISDAFPSILIAALRGLNNENNPDETIMLTAVQSSWLGSTLPLFKLCGSVLSGWATGPFGRKKAMIFVNIPSLIAWAILYYSTALTEVFLAQILIGLGLGLMQAPIMAYVGEICEPSIRGVLMATSSIFVTLAFFIVLLLGSLTAWRNAALFCMAIPIMTMICVSFIPETPMWLLSKNRDAEALQSLQWLRGWVQAKAVQNELEGIKRYSEYANSCAVCTKAKQKCLHPPAKLKEQLKELVRQKTLKPFFILMILTFLGQFSGSTHLMPYMVQILRTYGSPISPTWATVTVGAIGIVAPIICALTIKFVGKRRIFLISLIGVCLSNIALGIYGFSYLPPGCSSFNTENLGNESRNSNYFPLLLFMIMRFFTQGIATVLTILVGELFPFKTRGLATGLARAINFVFTFIAMKTFYNLDNWLSLQGANCFYGFIGFIGLIATYKILPETEGRTLEDIEIHFSDNQKKFTDRKIQKNAVAENIKATVDVDRAINITDIEAADVAKIVESNRYKDSYSNKGYISDLRDGNK